MGLLKAVSEEVNKIYSTYPIHISGGSNSGTEISDSRLCLLEDEKFFHLFIGAKMPSIANNNYSQFNIPVSAETKKKFTNIVNTCGASTGSEFPIGCIPHSKGSYDVVLIVPLTDPNIYIRLYNRSGATITNVGFGGWLHIEKY